jgi:TonB family protein
VQKRVKFQALRAPIIQGVTCTALSKEMIKGNSVRTTRKHLIFFYMLLLLARFAQAQEEQINLFPITDVAPEYPTEAIVREIEGWVLVSFDVSALGTISNIEVSDSEPKLTFDDSAINAASKFRFKPYIEDGIARDVTGIEYVFRFSLSGSPESVTPVNEVSLIEAARNLGRVPRLNQRGPSISQITNESMLPIATVLPIYPEEALNENIGGWVLLRFDVTDQGKVLRARVEDSEPPNVFDTSSINAITEFEYAPYDPAEGAFDRLNVFHLFKFRPQN